MAANNFYYDENKDVARGALWGAAGAGSGTYFSSLISNSLKDMPPSVAIPYFQTPATITIPLPAATSVGKGVETILHGSPAFVPQPDISPKPDTERGEE
ncbi:hypothetical protein [Alkalimonas sp. NCh-2]|uniref:hypothetical protein n=1 Tax=Alkalimonas sp. NCh-2 TaxID=3144846 RepID=UPI0031F6ECE8